MAQLTDVCMSANGHLAVAKIQELYSEFDLNMTDGMLVAAELLGWATMVSMDVASKEEIHDQMRRNFASIHRWLDDNYEVFKARQQVLAEIAASGSSVQ